MERTTVIQIKNIVDYLTKFKSYYKRGCMCKKCRIRDVIETYLFKHYIGCDVGFFLKFIQDDKETEATELISTAEMLEYEKNKLVKLREQGYSWREIAYEFKKDSYCRGGIAGFVLCSILTMVTVSELRQTITILRMELDKYRRSENR